MSYLNLNGVHWMPCESRLNPGRSIFHAHEQKITYPARFQLVAAMNPSPTGHYQGNHNRCTPEQTLRYLNRLSGPFLDRFDLSLEIPLPPPGILSKTVVPGESSATVKQRVMVLPESANLSGRIN